MKKIFLIILTALLTTSCASTYYYSTLTSTNKEMKQVDNGDFLLEKDDLWIAYSFNGEGVPIRITIYNKSQTPLYVDWSKSVLILGEQTKLYPKNMIAIAAAGEVSQQLDLFDTTGKFIENKEGKVDIPSYLSLLPPQTMITHTPAWFSYIDYSGLPKKQYEKTTVNDKAGVAKKVDEISFDFNSTPISFKCYLSIIDNSKKRQMYSNEFFVKKIVKTKSITPNDLPSDLLKRGDLFFTKMEPNSPSLNVAVGSGLVVGSGSIDVVVDRQIYPY